MRLATFFAEEEEAEESGVVGLGSGFEAADFSCFEEYLNDPRETAPPRVPGPTPTTTCGMYTPSPTQCVGEGGRGLRARVRADPALRRHRLRRQRANPIA